MKFPDVAIAVLNYNTRHYLEKFLPSVFRSSYPDFKVVVIDNASTDDSVEFIKREYPQAELVCLDKNYGFAGGYNEGLKHVLADYFILLNSDVEVPRTWIEAVVDAMEKEPLAAAAQPKILSYRDGHLFEYAGASGGFIDSFGFPFCRGRIFDLCEEDKGQYNETREIFWASGAAMFVKSEAWRAMKGLDADFFAHMEEIDFCWRLKNKGYKVLAVPASRVYHVGGGTLNRENPRKTKLNFRNALIAMTKNMALAELAWKLPVKLCLDGLAGIRFFLAGQWSNTLAIVQAHFAFYRGLWYWLGKRKESRSNMQPNHRGKMRGSVVWQYYIAGKKHFDQVDGKIRK
jgi:GT2 family glycosyltransferase